MIDKMNAALNKAGLQHLIGFSPDGVMAEMTHGPSNRHACRNKNLAAWDAAWDAALAAAAHEAELAIVDKPESNL